MSSNSASAPVGRSVLSVLKTVREKARR
jgi:hypothetical protein